MTPAELKSIRNHLGMSTEDFGAELGLSGTQRNNGTRIAEYERGKRVIPPYLARLAFMLQDHFDCEDGHLPEWPVSCATN